jgi:hypothetical protein
VRQQFVCVRDAAETGRQGRPPHYKNRHPGVQGGRYLHREEAALAAFLRDDSLRAGLLNEGYLLG